MDHKNKYTIVIMIHNMLQAVRISDNTAFLFHGDLIEYGNRLLMLIATKPTDGGYALDLLMIAKYFERIGDHAENIAYWVVFSVTATHKGKQT